MNKEFEQSLIIVEGTRGAGKTTITSWLREAIPYSQLIRLSGTADKSLTGKQKVFKARMNDFIFAENLIGCDLHTIMDRCFLSEYVYADFLPYKEYSFKEETFILAQKLNKLPYKKKFLINMYVGSPSVLEERLKREKADFQDIKFSTEESIKQQQAYFKAIDSLKDILTDVEIINFDASGTLEQNKEALKLILGIN